MTRPEGRFLVCTAITECDGWKIDYSADYCGHYIEDFVFFASFDKAYGGSARKRVKINIQTTETIEEAYEVIHKIYGVPYCSLIIGGNFGSEPVVKVSDDTDMIEIIASDNKKTIMSVSNERICKIPVDKFGFYTVIPHGNGKKGMDSRVWYCEDMNKLFDLSCLAIEKPYHGDDNLCEGGCFLWAMLVNMRERNNRNFDAVAKKELADIMGKNNVIIPRRTIVPYKTEKYDAYHIAESNRIQEQFFGVSILIEAYKLYGDREFLEHAVSALLELVNNWITDKGMIYNGEDYTTVCAPVIAIVDMANILKDIGDERSVIFQQAAIKVAEFLIERGMYFPTEGGNPDLDEDAEDGSISCTALSLLYVCANLHYDKNNVEFAKEVLKLHEAWTIFSNDVRMNASSFRWWETIWEGDGEGPAICAGHAWTIWKAEALYIYGMLCCDEKAIIESWNGFMSNFVKTEQSGKMFSCYEPDYIRGGGCYGEKKNLKTLAGEDISVKYETGHDYPKHYDNSLSRYAWIRSAYSWLHTAVILSSDGKVYGLNIGSDNNMFIAEENIEKIFIGKMKCELSVKVQHKICVITLNNFKIIQGKAFGEYIEPVNGIIRLNMQ